LVSTTFQTKVTPLQASIRQIIGQQLEVRTAVLVVLNVVCRVQTVTSRQQETVSKNDCRFNHANKQFFAQTAARRSMVSGGGVRLTAARRSISVGGSGVRNSATRRHRRGAARTSTL
jgi:hypothetical protein